MASRPVVGVTGPVEGGFFAWTMTRLAIYRAGGRAVRITTATMNEPDSPHPGGHIAEDAKDSGTFPDALILGGGTDIMPDRYGEELLDSARDMTSPMRRLLHYLHPGVILLGMAQFILRMVFSIKTRQPQQDAERDTMEMALCRRALALGVPVLGICRGAQLLNITLGGTLYQDTASFYAETPKIHSILPKKSISIAPGSRLHSILGTDTCTVNSLHEQAVNALGTGLTVSARESTDVVQAVEDSGKPFVLGVQWHPEYMPQSRTQQRIFQELVRLSNHR